MEMNPGRMPSTAIVTQKQQTLPTSQNDIPKGHRRLQPNRGIYAQLLNSMPICLLVRNHTAQSYSPPLSRRLQQRSRERSPSCSENLFINSPFPRGQTKTGVFVLTTKFLKQNKCIQTLKTKQ